MFAAGPRPEVARMEKSVRARGGSDWELGDEEKEVIAELVGS